MAERGREDRKHVAEGLVCSRTLFLHKRSKRTKCDQNAFSSGVVTAVNRGFGDVDLTRSLLIH